VAIIENGIPKLRRETKIADLVVRTPSVDIRTVGAGGGSIAQVPEATKALRVGPQSAGATPGPACYGRGGLEATVTDANLVLGYLPDSLLGGLFKLDIEAARRAVQKVADVMEVSLFAAAEGILEVSNEKM
jgi:N-methylhydantoinase A/oxoprolinase/acetone carboxylase beta subunit